MANSTIRCSACSAEKTTKETKHGARVPRGWKRHESLVYCGKCWSERYVLRAVVFPLAGPVGADWKELRAALDHAWRNSTACANWMIDELRAADVRRGPSSQPGEKMPAKPKTYLYPAARSKFPDLPSEVVNALEQSVTRTYAARRYQTLWLSAASLPTFRYPMPYPVASGKWSASIGEGGEPLVSVRVGMQRFMLRLRGGREFRRQLATHKQIVARVAVPCDLSIFRRQSPGKIEHGDGKPKASTIMVKLAAWVPRSERATRISERFFSLRTDADSLLYGILQDREQPWIVNGDRARDWIYQHERWLRRTGDDLKYERQPKRRRAIVNRDYGERARKYHDRMATYIAQTCAEIVGFASRNNVTRIKYDDTCKAFSSRFPWQELKAKLVIKAEEAGIAVELANDSATRQSASLLGESKRDVEEAI